jgi:hypothetical protein
MLSHRDPWFGWSAGFLPLCLNFFIATTVGALTPVGGASDEVQVLSKSI